MSSHEFDRRDHAEPAQQSGEIPNLLGEFGIVELDRSDGRAYWTLADICQSSAELQQNWQNLCEQSQAAGRRRTVLRAIVTPEVVQEANRLRLPIEASIPLRTGTLLVVAENRHRSTAPEWETVASDWLDAAPVRLSASERLARLPAHYQLVSQPTQQDVESLTALWTPFGWSTEATTNYIATQQTRQFGSWFSGVRDMRSGRLVSACMGQGGEMAGEFIVEATEFGTLQEYTGQGLCTAAVIALQAQIIRDSRATLSQLPFVFAECSTDARSDMVARNSGHEIPGLNQKNRHLPWQVLRRNVAVLDGLPENDIDGEIPDEYSAAFAEGSYRHWRNFVITALSPEGINRHYSPAACQEILARIRPVTR